MALPISSAFCSNLNGIPNQEYVTDEVGNVYININIIGHVARPGAYLVNENSDIITILSQAGGILPGAKMNRVAIYTKDSGKVHIDLKAYLDTGDLPNNYKFGPNDTIYVKQTVGSYLFSKSNIINSVLQILNIYLTISVM
ncbi:hypothetical protein CL656_04445 [bacterium]|nr:hypothetical protein [bacterium]|tara:strand:- start:473 stop:895 length:423 start_codon:yes stop_codon:yes gene_type:complete